MPYKLECIHADDKKLYTYGIVKIHPLIPNNNVEEEFKHSAPQNLEEFDMKFDEVFRIKKRAHN